MVNKKFKKLYKNPLNVYAGGGMFSSAIEASKGPDITDIEKDIKNSVTNNQKQTLSAKSNDDLMSIWGAHTNMANINLGSTSVLDHIGTSLDSASQGAAAGSAGGPLGAGIGAGVGALVGIAGSLFGANAKRKKQEELDRKVKEANAKMVNTLSLKAGALDTQGDINSLANVSAFGGELNQHGGDFSNGVVNIGEGGSHEDNPNSGVQVGVDPEGIPNLVEQGEVKVGNFIFSDRIHPEKDILNMVGLNKNYNKKTYAKVANKLGKESKERPNDPISNRGLTSSMTKLMKAQEAQKDILGQVDNSQSNIFKKGGGMKINPRVAIPKGVNTNTLNKLSTQLNSTPKVSVATPSNSITKSHNNTVNTGAAKAAEVPKDKFDPMSLLRYAPAIGGAAGAISDLFGGNKPDYTSTDSITSGPNVKASPIGNYMTFNPMDRDYYSNKLSAQSAATRRAIENTAGGNSGAAMAGILAADNNAQNAMGNLYRQSEESNLNQRQKIEEFNRGTNMYNSEADLKAQGMNNENAMRQSLFKAQLMDSAIIKSSGAKSANLTNFLDSVGDVGKEAYTNNMIKSNPALGYSIDPFTGKVVYKKTAQDQANYKSALREKLNRNNTKNKKGFTYGR